MVTSRWMLRLILLFAVCEAQAQRLCAQGEAQTATLKAAARMTAKDAEALEEGLRTNPDNLTAREKLIKYYFMETVASPTRELEERREKHVLWLIEHNPDSDLAGSPETEILPMGLTGSTEGYQRGKQLWLEQAERHPDNQRVLRNAGQFLAIFDTKIGQGLLEKALALDPGDPQASSKLAHSYEMERVLASSPEQKAILAQKALSIRERGLERTEGTKKFHELADLATSAFEAGETEKAQQYASELLQSTEQFKKDWNYGNALHKGNIVLGRVALKKGDIEGAKEHLIAAGQTPGSPQLDSFGPNMTLAKELLEKGEREAVLTYLESCGKFWKMHGEKLQSWMASVRGGGIPDFGANLLY